MLALMVTAFVILAVPAASMKLAIPLSMRRDVGMKRMVGGAAEADIGTPLAKVAVIAVALLIVADVLSAPLIMTVTV